MPLTLDCNNPPDGEVGVPYTHPLAYSGGTAPYRVLGWVGVVPPGLTLATTGVISGTPTQAGTWTFTARVVDAAYAEDLVTCAITIAAAVTIECNNPPGGQVGVAYDHSLTTAGGTPPRTVTIVGGSLPPGLSMDANGHITGTPATAGTYTFTARAAGS